MFANKKKQACGVWFNLKWTNCGIEPSLWIWPALGWLISDSDFGNILKINSNDATNKTSPLKIDSNDASNRTSPLKIDSNDATNKTSPLKINSNDATNKTSPLKIDSNDATNRTSPLKIDSNDATSKTFPLKINSNDATNKVVVVVVVYLTTNQRHMGYLSSGNGHLEGRYSTL